MFRTWLIVVSALSLASLAREAQAACYGVDPKAATSLGGSNFHLKFQCTLVMRGGYPVPDQTCTPGAINPTVTAAILRAPGYLTSCVRDYATTGEEKASTYLWYDVPHPPNNNGKTQFCELDHLVPLELGGADTLDNIWPECGPAKVALSGRDFKQKDLVENYLAREVRAGRMDLAAAQRGIARDWTQYLPAARTAARR